MPCYYSTPAAIYPRLFGEPMFKADTDCTPSLRPRVMKCKWYTEALGTFSLICFSYAMFKRMFKNVVKRKEKLEELQYYSSAAGAESKKKKYL